MPAGGAAWAGCGAHGARGTLPLVTRATPLLVLLAALAGSACVIPVALEGKACDAEHACVAPYVCGADGTCQLAGSGAEGEGEGEGEGKG